MVRGGFKLFLKKSFSISKAELKIPNKSAAVKFFLNCRRNETKTKKKKTFCEAIFFVEMKIDHVGGVLGEGNAIRFTH